MATMAVALDRNLFLAYYNINQYRFIGEYTNIGLPLLTQLC